MEFNDFLTIDYIATYVGTTVTTMLMVQFLKELPIIKDIPTKYFTFVLAFFNILMCSILTGNFAIKNVYLMIINSMLVTFTATGGYDFSIKKIDANENNIRNNE